MAIRLSDQTKTAQGRFPTRAASLDREQSTLAFDLYTAQELAKSDQEVPAFGIEDLAVIRTLDDAAAFAGQTGPLFGVGNDESIDDWQDAIAVAHTVTNLQEMLNGAKPFVAEHVPVQKSMAVVESTSTAFSIYAVSFGIGGFRASDGCAPSDYAKLLPGLPWLRKFSHSEGIDYSFVMAENVDDRLILSAFLLCFPAEISVLDFAAALRYFADDEAVIEEALVSASADAAFSREDWTVEGVMGLLADEANLTVSDQPLSAEDFSHLQKLVYALISLHLEGVRVDVFSSSESDDFMAFESYLSYLWYVFARKLGQVRIGYCEECGKGFSLTGHRGIKRRFCSTACKTKAKNARMKDARDTLRERFASGESVKSLALDFFPKEDLQEGQEHVLAQLHGWKALQHDLDAAIVQRGDALGFIQRMIEEGIITKEEVAMRARYIKENPRVLKAALARKAPKVRPAP